MKQAITYVSLMSLVNLIAVLGLAMSTQGHSTSPTLHTKCLIKIDNRTYDVSSFRNTHTGGDIFVCGTDMSSTFHRQHNNSYLTKLLPYAI